MAAIMFLSVISCKSSNKFVLSDNDEYYEIQNEGDSGSTSDTAENTSDKATESKTPSKDSVSSTGKKNNKNSEERFYLLKIFKNLKTSFFLETMFFLYNFCIKSHLHYALKLADSCTNTMSKL